MIWNADQQRMLSAMGYELLVRAPIDLPPGAGAMPAFEEPSPSANSVTAGQTANFPALQQALRRAAGDQDVSALIVDLERLRRDPALKRALWPQLRSLRRSH